MRYSPAIDFFEVGDISPLILSNKKSLYYLDMCRRSRQKGTIFNSFVIVELTLFFFFFFSESMLFIQLLIVIGIVLLVLHLDINVWGGRVSSRDVLCLAGGRGCLLKGPHQIPGTS